MARSEILKILNVSGQIREKQDVTKIVTYLLRTWKIPSSIRTEIELESAAGDDDGGIYSWDVFEDKVDWAKGSIFVRQSYGKKTVSAARMLTMADPRWINLAERMLEENLQHVIVNLPWLRAKSGQIGGYGVVTLGYDLPDLNEYPHFSFPIRNKTMPAMIMTLSDWAHARMCYELED